MKTKRMLFFSLAMLWSLTGLAAEIQVKTDASKPSEGVALSSEPKGLVGNITTYKRGTGEFRRVGQAFLVEGKSFDLTGFTWKIWNFDAQVEGKKFSIQVFRLSAINKAPDIVNDLLLSEEGDLPEVLQPEDFITFKFGKEVRLERGECYLILFGFEEPTSKDSSAKSLGFQRTDEKAESGRIWVYNGETFTADNKSMTFFLHGK